MPAFRQLLARMPVEDFQLGGELASYKRDAWLAEEAIKALLRAGPMRFAVADVGHELRLIDGTHCFTFWKTEVERHLAATSATIRLEDYPDEYVYFASSWLAPGLRPLILLEKQH